MRITSLGRNRRRGDGGFTLGFTLVELLVVIGIIALLIAILMPALRKAREQANEAICSSNQRQIMMAFLMFAVDSKGHLPGNFTDFNNPDHTKRAWLLNFQEPLTAAPEGGTIYRYLKNKEVYRCPSIPADAVMKGNGSSNGQFDYVSFGVFTGAKITNIKPQAKFTKINGRWEFKPTPVITEEHATSINQANVEGLHNYSDRMADAHRKGGLYASIDGSVHWHQEKLGVDQGAMSWTSAGPRGSDVNMGQGGFEIAWGWWNRTR
jgi:prepilin-type N-terminal cleavage/methylation domain-containing protein